MLKDRILDYPGLPCLLIKLKGPGSIPGLGVGCRSALQAGTQRLGRHLADPVGPGAIGILAKLRRHLGNADGTGGTMCILEAYIDRDPETKHIL